MRLPSPRQLAAVWALWAGLCLGSTIASAQGGEPAGVLVSGSAFVVSVALGVYCWRGFERP